MALEKNIMEDIKSAMKAKDKTALEALRAVKSAILLAKTDGKGEELSEADEISILQKQIKMRKDAAEQFKAQDRADMAEKELEQASVIEKYLPKQMAKEEIIETITNIIKETGANGMKDMGNVMSLANKQMAGKAESKIIAEEVKRQLNS